MHNQNNSTMRELNVAELQMVSGGGVPIGRIIKGVIKYGPAAYDAVKDIGSRIHDFWKSHHK